MFELYEIARNSKWEVQNFASKILPVPVEWIRFDDPDVLEKYFDYWENQEKKWEKLIQRRTGQISTAQSDRHQKTKSINQNFGQLADWLTDINAMNTELLSANNFEVIKQTVQKRFTDLSS